MARPSGPWNLCCDIAVMLEEIEMPPSLFLKIMSLAHLATHWTGILSSPIGLDPVPQLMRGLVGIENLSHNPPGRSYPQSQEEPSLLPGLWQSGEIP
jgi:hypothetical protein